LFRYSAEFYGHTFNTLLIASGTVFNQVLLWNPFTINSDSYCKVLQKLVGHEVFSFKNEKKKNVKKNVRE